MSDQPPAIRYSPEVRAQLDLLACRELTEQTAMDRMCSTVKARLDRLARQGWVVKEPGPVTMGEMERTATGWRITVTQEPPTLVRVEDLA